MVCGVPAGDSHAHLQTVLEQLPAGRIGKDHLPTRPSKASPVLFLGGAISNAGQRLF